MVLHNGLLKDEYSHLSELAADLLPQTSISIFSTIIDLALTLPISTARAECYLSVVKKILAPQRLSMDFERKSHLVLLAFNKDLTSSIDLDLFVDSRDGNGPGRPRAGPENPGPRASQAETGLKFFYLKVLCATKNSNFC